MKIGRFRWASALATCVVALAAGTSPAAAQEQAAAAPAPELTVEIRPDKWEWLEAETIRGVVVFRNTGAADVLMPAPNATPVAMLRRVDGVPLEHFVPTVRITGQPGYFEPDMLAPGSTRSRSFSIDTEPLEPRYWAGWVAPPGEYELAFAGLAGLEGVRIVQSPTRIAVKRGEVAVGERIVEWASDGWMFAAQRESGATEAMDLATGARLWASISDPPRRTAVSPLHEMRKRLGIGPSRHRLILVAGWMATLDPGRCGEEGWTVPLQARRVLLGFRDAITGESSPVRPLTRQYEKGASWFWSRSEPFGETIDELVRVDDARGLMSRWPLRGGHPWAVAPRGDYLVGGDDLLAGHRHAPKIGAASLQHDGRVGEWRTLFESAHIDPPEGVSGEDVHHFAWLAGVDGVYRARVGGGVRFVSYDGEMSFDIESDLWFPIEESEDGKYIALASSFGQRTKLAEAAPMTVEVWDVAERRRVLRIEAPDMFDVRIGGLAERLAKVDVMGDYETRWYGNEVEVYSLVRGELEFVRTINAGAKD